MADPLLDLLPKARRRWAKTDPVMARLAREAPPAKRSVEKKADPFAALVESITHQQVSLAAGRTIYKRVVDACRGDLTARRVAQLGEPGLARAGLSPQKRRYVDDLARQVAGGAIAFERFPEMTDDEIVEALTNVKGIGPWTARMFLLFHLDRPDVLAPDDLGLQIAVANAYRVPRARAAKKMIQLAPAWSPYASVAALTLWNWRRILLEKDRARPSPARNGG